MFEQHNSNNMKPVGGQLGGLERQILFGPNANGKSVVDVTMWLLASAQTRVDINQARPFKWNSCQHCILKIR